MLKHFVPLTVLFVLSLATAPSALGAEARLLAAGDLPAMGGTDFKGGVGDYLLPNAKGGAGIPPAPASPERPGGGGARRRGRSLPAALLDLEPDDLRDHEVLDDRRELVGRR